MSTLMTQPQINTMLTSSFDAYWCLPNVTSVWTGTKTRRHIGANGEWRKTKKSRCSISAAAITLLSGRSFRSPAFRSPTASQYRSEVMTFRSVVRHSCSGRPVPALHYEHVQPNVEQESCLHIPADNFRSPTIVDPRHVFCYRKLQYFTLFCQHQAATHSRYTPQCLLAQVRDLKRQTFF
jgi:hypothetical protein